MPDKEHPDDKTQAKLDRLARIDEKNRIRVRRYHEKVKAAGGKQLSAIISGEAYDQICRIRDKELQAGKQISFGKIVEQAIACYIQNQGSEKPVNDTTNVTINDKINDDGNGNTGQKPIREIQTEIPGPMPKPIEHGKMPDYLIDVDPDMSIEERHKIILQLAEDFPGRGKGTIGNTQKRIDMLNAAGILLNGKPWKMPKQFADQLSIARRWVKKQEGK